MTYDLTKLKNKEWTKMIFKSVANSSLFAGWTSRKSYADVLYIGPRLVLFRNGSIHFRKPKFEIGSKSTDWSPAPEDAEDDIKNVQDTANDAYNKANEASNSANTAWSEINKINGTIQNFVKDENGYVSITTSASGGIQIDMSTVTNKINEAIDNLTNKVDNSLYEKAIKDLLSKIDDTTARTAYINASTENGKPVITLGATESPFKLKITNTAIEFIQNNQVIATANGDAFFSNRSIAATEVQIGPASTSSTDAFGWQIRANGNLGLAYKQV